jgi:hypothetical protein
LNFVVVVVVEVVEGMHHPFHHPSLVFLQLDFPRLEGKSAHLEGANGEDAKP